MSGSGSSCKVGNASETSKSSDLGIKEPPQGRSYPICTSCAKPASSIYKLYTPTLIVLVRCSNPECKQLVDSYGDEECRPSDKSAKSRGSSDASSSYMSGSWMDLILVKPRAYRHFLYNVPFLFPEEDLAGGDYKGKGKEKATENGQGNPDLSEATGELQAWRKIIKRLVGLSLVDGYLRWFYLCAYSSSPQQLVEGYRTRPPPYTLPYVFAVLVKHAGNAGHSILKRLSDAAAGRTAMDVNILQQMGVTEKMLGSYLMVWMGTLLETTAMYATVTLASYMYVQFARRWRQRNRTSKSGNSTSHQQETRSGDTLKTADGLDPPGPIDVPPDDVDLLDLYRPSLIPNALLLSSLTTLLLLSIVLLWESKLPRPDGSNVLLDGSTALTSTSDLDAFFPPWISKFLHIKDSQLERDMRHLGVAFSTDFAVRTLLGGLNAGVSLAVIHPKLPILTTSLLLLGWFVAYHVRVGFTLLPSDVGPGGAPAGGQRWSFEAQSAVGWYCTSCH